MSIKLIEWAWGLSLKLPSTKLVLISLADHSRDCGCSFPSTKRIAELTGLSQRSVQHHIKVLRKDNIVKSRVKLKAYPCKSKFKLNLPLELEVKCTATGCVTTRNTRRSSVSTKVDTYNRNITVGKESNIQIPKWLRTVDLTTDIGLVDNIKNPAVKDWVIDIEEDFKNVDILAEAKKYSLWWEGKKAKKPKLAFRNWLEKASKDATFIKRSTKGTSHRISEIDSETREIADKIRKQQE